MHVRPFQKLARLDHGLEFRDRNEMVVPTVYFTFARGTRCKRNRITKIRYSFQHATDERALAAARRRADDDEHAARFGRGHARLTATALFRLTQTSALA